MRSGFKALLKIIFVITLVIKGWSVCGQVPGYTNITDLTREGVRQVLHISYDGDKLANWIEVNGKDTTAFFKAVLSDIQRRFTYRNSIGEVYSKQGAESLYNGTSEGEVVKNGNDITYTYNLETIPIIMDGVDSLEFRIAAKEVDSVIFLYKGGTHALAYTKPTALLFAHDSVIWKKENLITRGDTVKFTLIFEGPSKGIFSFSRATLQLKNQRFTTANEISNSLLFALPFLCLWLIFLVFRAQIENLPGNVYKLAYTWLPALSGVYLTVFISELLYYINDIYFRGDIYAIGSEDERVIKSRVIITGISLVLIVFGFFWKRGNQITGVIIAKKMAAVVGFSGLAFVFFGLLNYALEAAFSLPDYKMGLAESMKLVIKMRHAVPFTIIEGVFILICTYKLFSFKKQAMLLTSLPILAFVIIDVILFFPPQEINYNGIQASLSFSIFVLYELLPLIPAILLIVLLDTLNVNFSGKRNVLFAGWACTFLIAFYALPSLYSSFIHIPVILFFGIIICQLLLLVKPNKALRLTSIEQKVFEVERLNKSLFTRVFEIKQLKILQEKYKQKFLKGDMLPAEYDKAKRDLEQKMTQVIPEGITEDVIKHRLEFGIHPGNAKNALAGSGAAFVICFPLLLFYDKFFQRPGEDLTTDLFLNVIVPGAFFTLAGYCLGYFFPFIRGSSGWQKGFFLGLCMAFAKLPYQFLMSDELMPMFFLFPIMKELLIMTLVGFVAFDFQTIKKIYGRSFTFKHLAHIEGWSSVILFITIVLSAIMAGITAWITGNVTSLLDQFGKGH